MFDYTTLQAGVSKQFARCRVALDRLSYISKQIQVSCRFRAHFVPLPRSLWITLEHWDLLFKSHPFCVSMARPARSLGRMSYLQSTKGVSKRFRAGTSIPAGATEATPSMKNSNASETTGSLEDDGP